MVTAILRTAAELGCDLIVLSSHGYVIEEAEAHRVTAEGMVSGGAHYGEGGA